MSGRCVSASHGDDLSEGAFQKVEMQARSAYVLQLRPDPELRMVWFKTGSSKTVQGCRNLICIVLTCRVPAERQLRNLFAPCQLRQ